MMKISIILIISISVVFGNMYELKPIKITNAVTCFIGDFNPPMKSNKGFVSNVCYIDIGNSVVVLEPGPTYNFAKELNRFIAKKLDKPVRYVIATNFHDDRYTGASYYKDKNIPIIAHKTIIKELKQNPDKFNRIPKITTKKEYANSKIVQPDILTEDKYIIKGSKRNLQVLKLSPGSNSVSDISIYSPKDNFIFVGNIVFNGRFIKYGKYSNIDNWIKALEKLQKMDIKYVLGGHGSQYDRNSYKNNLEYLKLLRKSVKNAYENDVDREDIKNHVDDKKYNFYAHFKSISKGNSKTYFDQLEWE